MAFLLSPSILSADFGKLQEQIEIINDSSADLIHIDIMDGVFVPNISFGFTILDSLVKYVKKPLDIHLMIIEPDKYIQRFADYKPEYLTIHFESCSNIKGTINLIKSSGTKAGVAINPDTSVSLLQDVISDIDLVVIMSVNPGYGGQKFIQNSLLKISKTREMIAENKLKTLIEVDGGIDINNIDEVVYSGADIIVAGSAVFGSTDIKNAINGLKNNYKKNI